MRLLFLLLGTAALAAAIGLMVSSQRRLSSHRHRKSSQPLQHRLLPVWLTLAGVAFIGLALALAPPQVQAPPRQQAEIEVLLDQPPPPSGMPFTATPTTAPADDRLATGTVSDKALKLLILTWATPSDTDSAVNEQVRQYSQQVAALVADLARSRWRKLTSDTRVMSRIEFVRLESQPLALFDWCKSAEVDAVIAVGVGTIQGKETGIYATWREPIYEIHQCGTGESERRVGRVDERPGDDFLYQQGLKRELEEMLALIRAG